MRRFSMSCAIVVIVALVVAPIFGADEGRYIIVLKRGAAAPDIAAVGGRIEARNWWSLTVVIPLSAEPLLRKSPGVESILTVGGQSSPKEAEIARPKSIVANDTATLWATGRYGYDGIGDIVNIGAAAAPNSDGRVSTFQYDLAGRITNATVGRSAGDRVETYGYDGFGNMTTRSLNVTPGSYNPLPDWTTNRMTEAGMHYDDAGNLDTMVTTSFTYDAFNQMDSSGSAASPYTPATIYIYDANDERIAVQTGGMTHWTMRGADNKPLRQFDSTLLTDPNWTSTAWNWTEDYIWNGGSLIAGQRPTDNGPRHFHLDHLGTIRLVTDTFGTRIGAQHDYAPFGDEISVASTNDDLLKFTGHERDENLDYMHARYDDWRRGRFLSPDPLPWIDWQNGDREAREKFRSFIANPQNFNMYAYVRNNPINRTDPTGMAGCQAGDKSFDTCTIKIVYDPKTSKGTLTVTGQNKGDKTSTVLLKSRVVVGGDGHVTPTGTFTASVWEKDHVSTKYGSAANTPFSKTVLGGNAFGPYQLHIKELDSRGIYIHGTMGPSWSPVTWGNSIFLSPTSHGCVRMCNTDNVALHNMMPNPKGNKIIISTEDPED